MILEWSAALAFAANAACGEPPATRAIAVPAPCACQPAPLTAPAGGWWRVPNRPIAEDGGTDWEPRIRDQRFAPATAPLPGSFSGQRETLPVLPPYRSGYFRVFRGGR